MSDSFLDVSEEERIFYRESQVKNDDDVVEEAME